MTRVVEVLKIDLALSKSLPPLLEVSVTGKVPTLGWTDPILTAYRYFRPPDDRIQDFDFSATAPRKPWATPRAKFRQISRSARRRLLGQR